MPLLMQPGCYPANHSAQKLVVQISERLCLTTELQQTPSIYKFIFMDGTPPFEIPGHVFSSLLGATHLSVFGNVSKDEYVVTEDMQGVTYIINSLDGGVLSLDSGERQRCAHFMMANDETIQS